MFVLLIYYELDALYHIGSSIFQIGSLFAYFFFYY